MPSMKPLGEEELPKQNPYWSGRYLVMGVKHIISTESETYEMSLKCMKDAVRTSYEIETENSSVNEKEHDQSVLNIYEADSDYLQDDLLGDL